MDKAHKTHFTQLQMPWKKEDGMNKYKLFYYELARYIDALADDCDRHSGLLISHGIADPWYESREIYKTLPQEVKDHLQSLLEEEDGEFKATPEPLPVPPDTLDDADG